MGCQRKNIANWFAYQRKLQRKTHIGRTASVARKKENFFIKIEPKIENSTNQRITDSNSIRNPQNSFVGNDGLNQHFFFNIMQPFPFRNLQTLFLTQKNFHFMCPQIPQITFMNTSNFYPN